MDFPTPTGPCRMTDSPASTNRRVARSRMWAAGILGLNAKSKSSTVAVCSKWAACSRRSKAGGVAAGGLVLAQHLEELDVAELPAVGLAEPGLEGVEHPEQLQRRRLSSSWWVRVTTPAAGGEELRRGRADGRAPTAASRPRSSPSCSVPATRIPLTVR